jgi:hypothetical protein
LHVVRKACGYGMVKHNHNHNRDTIFVFAANCLQLTEHKVALVTEGNGNWSVKPADLDTVRVTFPLCCVIRHAQNIIVRPAVYAQITAPSPYRAVNTFHLGYKNQSVYAVSDTSTDRFI